MARNPERRSVRLSIIVQDLKQIWLAVLVHNKDVITGSRDRRGRAKLDKHFNRSAGQTAMTVQDGVSELIIAEEQRVRRVDQLLPVSKNLNDPVLGWRECRNSQ